jgi:glucans biosynthesis protein
MPVRLAGFAAALFSATAVAGCATSADVRPTVPVADIPPPKPNLSASQTADEIFATAVQHATQLAAQPYAAPADTLPAPFRNLDYDGYRKLRPIPDAALWHTAGEPFAILPLPRGHLYRDTTNLSIVEAGKIEPISDASGFFDFVDYPQATPAERQGLGASGWRVITRPGVAGAGYEVAVFQGASYFRVVGEGEFYGVSARALAIGAGSAEAEEFPRFTDFWIVRPAAGDTALSFVAVIDSPSISGAYRFTLTPGVDSVVDVTAELHPRRDISNPGIAPLSSMFHHGGADRGKFDDWRPEVHDSDGVAIVTQAGDQLWRPLTNPTGIQVTKDNATSMKGFGLEQRGRQPDAYADLEARYEKRPSVWIEPVGDWGAGEINVVQLPTVTEYDDNIAAFWRPTQPWRAGEVIKLGYKLHFTAEPPGRAPIARIAATRVGASPYEKNLRRFVIDFEGGAASAISPASLADVGGSAGEISNLHVVDGGAPGRVRLTFDLDPKGATAIDLHAALCNETSQQTETWLFRWTPE